MVYEGLLKLVGVAIGRSTDKGDFGDETAEPTDGRAWLRVLGVIVAFVFCWAMATASGLHLPKTPFQRWETGLFSSRRCFLSGAVHIGRALQDLWVGLAVALIEGRPSKALIRKLWHVAGKAKRPSTPKSFGVRLTLYTLLSFTLALVVHFWVDRYHERASIDEYQDAVNKGDRASACVQAQTVAEAYRLADDVDSYAKWLAFERDACSKDSVAAHTSAPVAKP